MRQAVFFSMPRTTNSFKEKLIRKLEDTILEIHKWKSKANQQLKAEMEVYLDKLKIFTYDSSVLLQTVERRKVANHTLVRIKPCYIVDVKQPKKKLIEECEPQCQKCPALRQASKYQDSPYLTCRYKNINKKDYLSICELNRIEPKWIDMWY